MSLTTILLIMGLMGITGGTVNFLLPANTDPSTNKRIRALYKCMILGVGATILVPLFLEFAQSKLLDGINSQDGNPFPLKNYLLFSSYCFLAAAAGFRFINSLIESVLKDKKIADLRKQKVEIEQKSNKLEKEIHKVEAHNRLRMETEEHELMLSISGSAHKTEHLAIRPKIGRIKHPDDPQKGRFGGMQVKNHRRLDASVSESDLPGFFSIKLWVQSDDEENCPLTDEVIFYLHDSFSPAVFSISPNKFTDGKAMSDIITAYGAFTVGAVTDKGHTLLELDLAEDKRFPEAFRNR